MDGVRWEFGGCLLPADPEDHKSVGRNSGGGVDGFAQPALGSTLVEFNCYLHREEKGRTVVGKGWGKKRGVKNRFAVFAWSTSLCESLLLKSVFISGDFPSDTNVYSLLQLCLYGICFKKKSSCCIL